MGSESLPKAWEGLMHSTGYVPVIVKSIENIFSSDWSMEPNKHEFFEMVYLKKGAAVFIIEGTPVDMGPDDIIIIKPNSSHKLVIKSKAGLEFIVLSFKFENHRVESYSEISLEDFLNFVKGRESGSYITLKVSQKNEIIMLLDRILKERSGSDIGSGFLANLYVMQLFVMISRALKMEWEKSIKNKSPKIKELIVSAEEYIVNNYDKDPSLDDISKYVFLSTSYFARAFKEHTGKTPMNYLQEVKIRNAKELLVNSSKKAGEIAFEVGFSSQQRFNDAFRKKTGLSPLQYRHSANKVKNR
ncbi:MAG: AraC family transcriptional regulator [Eubacteriales bacterium]|nr:AraC family transcriptional regulator [Eubacteriales bacterium]